MRISRPAAGIAIGLSLAMSSLSCIQMTHKLDQDKPLEINVNVKVQRELDDFYSFQDKYDPTTRPATQPVGQ